MLLLQFVDKDRDLEIVETIQVIQLLRFSKVIYITARIECPLRQL